MSISPTTAGVVTVHGMHFGNCIFFLLFFVFCFLFFGFCFLFLITTKVFQLKFKSRNYLTCFRHHLNTTRFGTRMQWSKRSERHRAHMYSYPWYWRSMANLPGSLALHHPSSRTMLSRMLVSLTTLSLLHSVLIIYSCSPQQRRVWIRRTPHHYRHKLRHTHPRRESSAQRNHY